MKAGFFLSSFLLIPSSLMKIRSKVEADFLLQGPAMLSSEKAVL